MTDSITLLHLDKPRSLARAQSTRLRFDVRNYGDVGLLMEAFNGGECLAEVEFERDGAERMNVTANFSRSYMRPHFFAPIHFKVKTLIRRMHADGVVRLQWAIDAADDKGHRWARSLGFEPEGLMRKYAKGRDHVLYSRVLANPQMCGR
jgi:hypothetical protein